MKLKILSLRQLTGIATIAMSLILSTACSNSETHNVDPDSVRDPLAKSLYMQADELRQIAESYENK